MTSKQAPVPSKNALVALRRLAFASPTVFAGAFGSACGIAALNYEARKRVKLAEQIVATKHTLRSVSNGRGQAHITRMCETAERGEDFTLDDSRAHKRRRNRYHSSLAFGSQCADGADVPALEYSIQQLYQQQRSPGTEPQSSVSGVGRRTTSASTGSISARTPLRETTFPPLEYRQPSYQSHKKHADLRSLQDETVHKQRRTSQDKHPPTAVLDRLRSPKSNSLRAEKIRAASQMPLKQDNYGVYARQTRRYTTSPSYGAKATSPRLSQAQAMVKENERWDGGEDIEDILGGVSTLLRPAAHRDIDTKEPRNELGTTNPPSPATVDLSFTEWDLSSLDMFPFLGNPEDESDVSQTSLELREIQTDPQPQGEIPEDTTLRRDDSAVSKETDSSSIIDFRQYFTQRHPSSDASVHKSHLTHTASHLKASPAGTSSEATTGVVTPSMRAVSKVSDIGDILRNAENQLRVFGEPSLRFVFGPPVEPKEQLESLRSRLERPGVLKTSLQNILRGGNSAAVSVEITRCLDIGTTAGVAQAEILFYAYYKCCRLSMRDPACCRLVADLLKDHDSALRGATILFPTIPDRQPTPHHNPSSAIPYRLGQQYLHWYCQNIADFKLWIQEAKKVASLAKGRGLALHERMLVPVLQALVLADQQRLAHGLFSDFKENWDMEFGFLGYELLVRGHALAGDWHSIRRILERLHSDGLSRTRPVGFSALFHHALVEYIRQKSLNEAYDYVIDATSTLGLIPTSSISTTLIASCLRQLRFDLVQEWVEVIRQLFPMVDVGTGNATAGWKVAQVWKDRESSCEEIETGCRAMSYAAVRDPFSASFRGIALEAVERDLRKRLSSATDLWNYPRKIDIEHDFPRMGLRDIMDFIEECVAKNPSSDSLPARPREQLQEILRQITATTNLNKIFEGELTFERFPNPKVVAPRWRNLKLSNGNSTETDFMGVITTSASLIGEKIPGRSKLWSLVSRYYVDRHRRGLRPKHEIMEHLIPRLTRSLRQYEALEMIESIYESPYAQGPEGTPLPRDTIGLWLQIATSMKSGRHISHALWALVDTDTDLSTDMLILVKKATAMTSQDRNLSEMERNEVKAEVNYLGSKLHKKHWIQKGARTEKQPRFAEFKTWEERMRVSRVP